jgi:hypothetical protein
MSRNQILPNNSSSNSSGLSLQSGNSSSFHTAYAGGSHPLALSGSRPLALLNTRQVTSLSGGIRMSATPADAVLVDSSATVRSTGTANSRQSGNVGGDLSSIDGSVASNNNRRNSTNGVLTTLQAVEMIFLNPVNSDTLSRNIEKSTQILDRDFGHILRSARGTTERESRDVNEKIKVIILAVFGKLGK